MAILTAAGRAAYQAAISQQSIHAAWGTGDVSWGSSPPAESSSATALLNEIGRREALQIAFVEPDPEGSIILPGGAAYELSAEPTRYLFMDFHFEFGDASASTIREVGVFIGTERSSGVSPSKAYLLPEEIDDPGQLLIVEHQSPQLVRSAVVRERFRYVISL
jgi:hypothetical protein